MSHLDGEHGDALWAVDAVPDAEVPSVLRHHHVAAGHPLDVRAEAQQRGLHAALYVVQLELGGGTDTGVLHCCLHQPPLKSGNQRANLRMPQPPENSAVSSDLASVHFAELLLPPEDPPLLQSAVLTPPPPPPAALPPPFLIKLLRL